MNFWTGFFCGFGYALFIVGCGRVCGLNRTRFDEADAIEAERGART